MPHEYKSGETVDGTQEGPVVHGLSSGACGTVRHLAINASGVVESYLSSATTSSVWIDNPTIQQTTTVAHNDLNLVVGGVDTAGNVQPIYMNTSGVVGVNQINSLPAGAANIGSVTIGSGSNNIGSVTIGSGSNNIGSVTIGTGSNLIGSVTVNALPTRSTANVGVTLAGDALMNNTTALTPKFAAFSASGSTNILSSVADKRLRVINYAFTAGGATAIKWQGDSTALTGSMPVAAGGGFAPGEAIYGHFQAASGTTLNIVMSSATQVGGYLVYVEV